MVEESLIEHDLSVALYRSKSIDEILLVQEQIAAHVREGRLSATDARRLQPIAFRALKELTVDDVTTAERLIMGPLLDQCLEDSEDVRARLALSQCRDCLKEWMEQYPEDIHHTLRDVVLHRLRDELESDHVTEACYTIATIGFRRNDIVTALSEMDNQRPGEDGDNVLATRVALGVPTDERPQVLESLHRRTHERLTGPLVGVAQYLADPSSIMTVQTWPDLQGNEERHFLVESFTLQTLTMIADASDDAELQDRVWMIIAGLRGTRSNWVENDINAGNTHADRCDSPYVITTLLSILDDAEGDTSVYHRYISCLRLQECVRPRQLYGWVEARNALQTRYAINALMRDAHQDSGETGRFSNTIADLKDNAWDALLRLQRAEVLEWFNESVAGETNSFVRQTICDYLSCFRLERLPAIAHDWITTEYDFPNNNNNDAGDEVSFRSAAIRLAHSCASRDAFDALIQCGFNIDGLASQETVDALNDVALIHAKRGDSSIALSLLQQARDARDDKRSMRQAASIALAFLATRDALPETFIGDLETLLSDDTREPYERSMFMRGIVHMRQGVLSEEMVNRLRMWAHNEDNWLGWRSLEVLVRQDLLTMDTDVMHAQLGLVNKTTKWSVDPAIVPLEWAGSMVGLLYVRQPMLFKNVVMTFIRDQTWNHVSRMLNQLSTWVETYGPFPFTAPFANALINRIRERQSEYSSETDIFWEAATLIPDRLALERWEDVWANWMADAKTTLADALAEATYTTPAAQERALSLLQSLARDAHYAVRRSAYRSLARIAPDIVRVLCEIGSQAPIVEIRHRSAEATGWLRTNDEHATVFNRVQAALAVDPEPRVRDAAQRAKIDRRERMWAEQYGAQVQGVTGRDNQETMSAWRYGQALIRVGDDTTVKALRHHILVSSLPPHVRFWLRGIIKGISDRWRDVTRKWPDPWVALEGKVDAGEGRVELSDGREVAVEYVLWSQPARTLTDVRGQWGGIAYPIPMGRIGRIDLLLPNGARRRIIVTGSTNHSAHFVGNGSYPL